LVTVLLEYLDLVTVLLEYLDLVTVLLEYLDLVTFLLEYAYVNCLFCKYIIAIVCTICLCVGEYVYKPSLLYETLSFDKIDNKLISISIVFS